MIGAVSLVIKLLQAAPAVDAIVADRIEPELAREGTDLPLIVVRGGTEAPVYGLARSTGLRNAALTVLCAAENYTAADRLAETVKAALRDVRHALVADQRVTVMQEGPDTGTWDEAGRTYSRIVGFRVSIGA